MLIGLTGKKQSGKTTVADYLCSYHNFSRFGFADPLKDICGLLYPGLDFWEEKEKESKDNQYGLSRREILQAVGTDIFRDQFNKDTWVNIMKYDIENNILENMVIHDVRFDNEAEAIHDRGGIIINLIRHKKPKGEHSSEDGISQHLIDHTISNNGTLNQLLERIEAVC